MSEGKNATSAFPNASSWEAIVASIHPRSRLHWHLSAQRTSNEAQNVLRTIDHLIAADVLIAANSGLSSTALFYATGVKVLSCCAR